MNLALLLFAVTLTAVHESVHLTNPGIAQMADARTA
jgi:hypothetical protein